MYKNREKLVDLECLQNCLLRVVDGSLDKKEGDEWNDNEQQPDGI